MAKNCEFEPGYRLINDQLERRDFRPESDWPGADFTADEIEPAPPELSSLQRFLIALFLFGLIALLLGTFLFLGLVGGFSQ